MARKGKQRSATSVKVDLSDIETRVRVTEEGTYPMKPIGIEQKPGTDDDYLSWKFQITDGDFENAIVYTNTSLGKTSLWNLRSLLDSLGYEIPDSEFDLDFEEIVDGDYEMMGVVEMEKYDGKNRAKLSDFAPMPKKGKGKKSKDDDDGEDDKKDKKGKKKKSKEKPDEDAVREMDADELEEVIKDHKLDVDLDDFKKLKEKQKAVWAALDDDGEDEDDDKKDKKSKKGKSKKIAQEDVLDMDQDALEELIKDHELDVDLDDYKTLKKMANAVIDALEKEDLIAA